MFKGIILHTIGKVAFVIGSYVMHYYLMHQLPDAVYGLVGVLITIINFEYLFLNHGIRQAISNLIAKNIFHTGDIVKKGLLYQGVLITVISLVTFFGASVIADLLNDATLTPYIRFAAYLVPFTGFYFALLGVLNGFKLFVAEACIVTIYPLLRLSVIPFVGSVFQDPLNGTQMGFLFAASGIFTISAAVLFKKRSLLKSDKPKVKHLPYIKSAVGFSIIFAIASVVMNLDTTILKMKDVGDAQLGYYTAAVTVGKVPFYLLSAFFLVVLPVVTRYHADRTTEKASEAIRDLLTIILSVVLPFVVIVSASSHEFLSLYSPTIAYTAASSALSFLLFGTFSLGLMLVFSMVLSAVEKKNFSTGLSLVMLFVFGIVCYLFSTWWGITGAGLTSLVVCTAAMLVGFWKVCRVFPKILNRSHFILIGLNIVAFFVVRIVVSLVTFPNLIFLLGTYIIIFLAFIAIFVFSGILSIQKLREMFIKDKASTENKEDGCDLVDEKRKR